MNIGFERIIPTPSPGVDKAHLIGKAWESRAGKVNEFKFKLKEQLRVAQKGLCCYCRRWLGDPRDTHLEHFVDKFLYPQFTFTIENIALSCSTCNGEKNRTAMKLRGFLKRFSNISGVATINECQTLNGTCIGVTPYPNQGARYRWVHPHFDDYSNSIAVSKGWIFSFRDKKGVRTIRSLRLNSLTQLERRAMEERLSRRTGLLSMMVGAIGELSSHEARDVCRYVANRIKGEFI